MIWIFSDYLTTAGGIETYLHALCIHLRSEKIPFRVAVCEMASCPVVDELEAVGIQVYRQRRIPGDRWSIRQRFLTRHVTSRLNPGDWVYCVRQPRDEIYESLVDRSHKRGARVAASWMLTPDCLPVSPRYRASFDRAVAKTDAVISVSHTGAGMYERHYGYNGKVHVVPYHNLEFFPKPLPLPSGPPWRFGYLGRIDDSHKNVFALVEGCLAAFDSGLPVTLDVFGGGPDLERLQVFTAERDHGGIVTFHGAYDHREDLARILRPLHCVVYTSHYEGGPCFSLLEAMQAGRYVLASPVGGIPDLYEGHPEAGILLSSLDSEGIAEGIRITAEKFVKGEISITGPRSIYDASYSMQRASAAWHRALEFPGREN